jgi:hypothetical protein
MRPLIAAWMLIAWPLWAAAHDGHGLQGAHWHATDSVGFTALAGIAALALWWGKKK